MKIQRQLILDLFWSVEKKNMRKLALFTKEKDAKKMGFGLSQKLKNISNLLNKTKRSLLIRKLGELKEYSLKCQRLLDLVCQFNAEVIIRK
jgi:hypothetical protein